MSATDAPTVSFLSALRTALGDTVLEPGSEAYTDEVLCFNLLTKNTPMS